MVGLKSLGSLISYLDLNVKDSELVAIENKTPLYSGNCQLVKTTKHHSTSFSLLKNAPSFHLCDSHKAHVGMISIVIMSNFLHQLVRT